MAKKIAPGSLPAQHEAIVAYLVAVEPGEETHPQERCRHRLLDDGCLDRSDRQVANDDFVKNDPCDRRGSVGGLRHAGIFEGVEVEAEPLGGLAAEHHEAGARIDEEIDEFAVDLCLEPKLTVLPRFDFELAEPVVGSILILILIFIPLIGRGRGSARSGS